MDDTINVPVQTLGEVANALSRARADFETTSSASAVTLGVSDQVMLDALEEFSGNWKKHRERLLKRIDAVQSMAAAAAESFGQADLDLFNALQSED
jgi:23S rRNA U2552 (ribose-2'-O)-methylase RlmE/FtsJ